MGGFESLAFRPSFSPMPSGYNDRSIDFPAGKGGAEFMLKVGNSAWPQPALLNLCKGRIRLALGIVGIMRENEWGRKEWTERASKKCLFMGIWGGNKIFFLFFIIPSNPIIKFPIQNSSFLLFFFNSLLPPSFVVAVVDEGNSIRLEGPSSSLLLLVAFFDAYNQPTFFSTFPSNCPTIHVADFYHIFCLCRHHPRRIGTKLPPHCSAHQWKGDCHAAMHETVKKNIGR
jgi:hypothetical protein